MGMATGKLLTVEPPEEIQFPFELNKQICSTMLLTNNTDQPVAFKVKTTNPKNYSVRPNLGFVFPRSNCRVVVTMQALKEAPFDYQIKDKFLIQSVVAASGNRIDITPEMASKTDTIRQDNTNEQKALIVRLMEERDSVVEQNNKLRQELELLRSDQAKRRHGRRCLLACLCAPC